MTNQKIILIVAIFILAATCTPTKDKTYVVVCFDVEDYTTPASEGIDEIPKWLERKSPQGPMKMPIKDPEIAQITDKYTL